MKWRDLCSRQQPHLLLRHISTVSLPQSQTCSYAPPPGTDSLPETAVQKDARPSWWPHSAKHTGSYLIGREELTEAQCSQASMEILHVGLKTCTQLLGKGVDDTWLAMKPTHPSWSRTLRGTTPSFPAITHSKKTQVSAHSLIHVFAWIQTKKISVPH